MEAKIGTESIIKTKSDTQQVKMSCSPIKSCPEDSPLRRALEQPPLKKLKVIQIDEILFN